ncbi:MAG: hypothetical protein LUD22_03055, partial [Coprobacillus sp.]|nr:hypothetical protein [Coprobacillus sp.]
VPLLIAILFLTWLYVLIASVICTIGLHAERGLGYPGWNTEHIYNFRFIYVQEIDNVYDEYGTFLSYWSVTRIYPCVNIIYNIGLFFTILVLYIRERKNIKLKEEKENK